MLKEAFEDYLFLNLKDYLDPGLDFPINIFLLSIAIGLCIATVLITIHKRYTTRLIKQLLRHNATTEESAKALSDLRIKPTFFLKGALSRSGQLTDMVKRVGEYKYTYQEYVALQKKKGFRDKKIDFATAKFYISSEKLDRAKRINESPYPSYINAALTCLLILSIFVIVSLFMPEFLSWIAQ